MRQKGNKMSEKWEHQNLLARQNGWVPRPNPAKVFGWCDFVRGGEIVWQISKDKYVRANKTGKETYASLEEALTGSQSLKRA